MSGNPVLDKFGIGLGLGIGIMMGITVIVLPASYMMNKLIYHQPAMRFVAGLVAGIFSIVSFIIIILMRMFGSLPKIHYFGLWPVVDIPGQGSYSGWLKILFVIYSYVFHPFIMFYQEEEDKFGYREAVKALIITEGKEQVFQGQTFMTGAVSEAFFDEARTAGALSDTAAWTKSMNLLSDAGKMIFGVPTVSTSEPIKGTFAELPKPPELPTHLTDQ